LGTALTAAEGAIAGSTTAAVSGDGDAVSSDGVSVNGVKDDGARGIGRAPNDGTGADGSAGAARKEAAFVT
jgi:hypothetical protein